MMVAITMRTEVVDRLDEDDEDGGASDVASVAVGVAEQCQHAVRVVEQETHWCLSRLVMST